MPNPMAAVTYGSGLMRDEERMIHWLGRAAKAFRQESDWKPSRIAGILEVDQSTVTRFENGEGWPTKVGVDEMLNAYVEACDLDHELEVWSRAETMWAQELDGDTPTE